MTSRETIDQYEAIGNSSNSHGNVQILGKRKQDKRGCCYGNKKILVYFTVAIILILCGGTLYFVAEKFIQSEINKKLVLEEGSQLYSMWLSPDIPIYMQFFTFHCDNHLEVLQGEKPSVIQKGPYSYREYRHKYNITWSPNNGTVLYNELHTYVFDPSTSCADCKETDKFTSVNIPYATLVKVLTQKTKELPKFIIDPILEAISLILEVNKYGLFTSRTVKDIAFGYNDPVLLELSNLLKKIGIKLNPFFGLQQNASFIGMTSVRTGKDNVDLLLDTVSWNGKTSLNEWNSKYANMLNGSDGTQFKPGITDADTIYTFVTLLFRSLYLTYDTVERIKGIDGLKFRVPEKELASGLENPDNMAFCPATGCLPTGLLDLSCCVPMNAPVVVSAPHFYQGNKKLIQSVYGMNPVEDEHASLLVIEPHLGVPLLAHKRLQINIHVKNYSDFRDMEKVRDVILPLLYVNESTVVDDNNAEKIKNLVLIPITISHGIEIGLVSVGGILLIVALVFFLRRNDREEKLAKVRSILESDENSPLMQNGSANT